MFEFALKTFTWEAISALSGIAIAVIGFMIGRGLRRRELRAQKYALIGEYRREIMAFSKEFFEQVAEALALRDTDPREPKTARRLAEISARLSGLADTGRFLFPNDLSRAQAGDAEDGPAFAGRRRPPLNAILAAHLAVEALRRDGDKVGEFLSLSMVQLRKTGQPLKGPVRAEDPFYLLIQSRRCYLNAVVPDTFPRVWMSMFTTLLGPVERGEEAARG